jgi:hypothetical protein
MYTNILTALLALSASASARAVTKARRQQHAPSAGGFILEVTTTLNGLSYFNYTPQETEPLPVSIEDADTLLGVTIVNPNNDVTCTVKAVDDEQIRLFGGNYANTYTRYAGDKHAEWIDCAYIVDYSKYTAGNAA